MNRRTALPALRGHGLGACGLSCFDNERKNTWRGASINEKIKYKINQIRHSLVTMRPLSGNRLNRGITARVAHSQFSRGGERNAAFVEVLLHHRPYLRGSLILSPSSPNLPPYCVCRLLPPLLPSPPCSVPFSFHDHRPSPFQILPR